MQHGCDLWRGCASNKPTRELICTSRKSRIKRTATTTATWKQPVCFRLRPRAGRWQWDRFSYIQLDRIYLALDGKPNVGLLLVGFAGIHLDCRLLGGRLAATLHATLLSGRPLLCTHVRLSVSGTKFPTQLDFNRHLSDVLRQRGRWSRWLLPLYEPLFVSGVFRSKSGTIAKLIYSIDSLILILEFTPNRVKQQPVKHIGQMHIVCPSRIQICLLPSKRSVERGCRNG